MKVKNKNKNLWSLCSPWDRRPTTNFGIWRIQCLPRFVNWHFLISLAKFFPSGSFLDASAGEPVALFFLQRRVTQSPWDRRPTTNFERWRIQSLPRFVNWHFLFSLAKLCPSIARLARTPMAGHLLFNLPLNALACGDGHSQDGCLFCICAPYPSFFSTFTWV